MEFKQFWKIFCLSAVGPPAILVSTGTTKKNAVEIIQKMWVVTARSIWAAVLQLCRKAYTFLKEHVGLYLTALHKPSYPQGLPN